MKKDTYIVNSFDVAQLEERSLRESHPTPAVPHPTPLTAREFFKGCLEGYSKTDAARGTGLAYTAVHDASCDGPSRKLKTLTRLMRWSFGAIEKHGCYLSATKRSG